MGGDGNLILEIEIDQNEFLFAGRRKHVYFLTRRQQEVLKQAVGRRDEETL